MAAVQRPRGKRAGQITSAQLQLRLVSVFPVSGFRPLPYSFVTSPKAEMNIEPLIMVERNA
jgi:hypothetical protein